MLPPMLVDDIKKKVAEAVKGGDTVARDVLRLALGEVQTAEARKNAPLTDDEVAQALRKLVKSNEETLSALPEGDARAATIRHEIAALTAILPAQLTPDQIVEALASVREAIKAAGNDGQATGVAMKHLKAAGATVSGKDVGAAVKLIRGAASPS
jgi:uncharacterized protein YqeY